LWQKLPAYRPPSNRNPDKRERDKAMYKQRGADLCRQGPDSRACKALYALGVLDPSVVLDEMQPKHPRIAAPDLSLL